MKPSSLPLNKLVLLVTTMLFSPSLAAAQTPQTPPAPQTGEQTPAPEPDEAEIGADGEIVVLGRFIPQPMRATSEVMSYLSSADLARSGDDNAALALTRLSGLSVVSGRFVYVRGLGDRYSSALLNGSPLPSPEPLRRQVPLDLFPSNILDGATVQKTFSPNYPGEFGGGVIDLRTVRVPNEPFFTVKAGTGGNTEAWGARVLTYRGERTDFTGAKGPGRDVPGPLAAAIAQHKLVNDDNFPTQIEAIGESLSDSRFSVVQREDFKPDFEGEATAGTSLDFGGYNLGLIGVVGYDSSIRGTKAHRQTVLDNTALAPNKDFTVTSGTWDIVFNTFGSASLGWGENSITLTSLLVRSTSKDTQIDVGTEGSRTADSVLKESTAWYERQLATVQLAGEHEIGDFSLKWRGALAQSKRDAPFERSVTRASSNGRPYRYDQVGRDNTMSFSDLTDGVVSGGVDGTYTLQLSAERDAVFSGGLSYSNSVREYNQRGFAYLEATNDPNLIPDSLRINRPDYLFQPDSIRPDGFVLDEYTGPDDSYKARMTVMAAYFGADVEIMPLVRAAAGVRYEDGTEIVRTFNTFNAPTFAVPTDISKAYWLPAGTLTWNFAEDLQLRLGYSQTIARPQFRELASSPYIDPDTDQKYQGNPYLEDSEFKNYDARLEYYFGRDQFVTFGGFYKSIDNPIEEVVSNAAGGALTRFINAPEATLFGAEAEYRTRFPSPFAVPFLTDPDFLFAINYTYTHSEVNGVDEEIINPFQLPTRVVPVKVSEFKIDGTPLQGTPENILNVQFGYETGSSSLTFLVGWVDERIARRGFGMPAVIEDPGVNFDAVFKKDFQVVGQDLTLSLSGRNLLDEDHQEYQEAAFGRSEANTYKRGRSFSASLTAKF